MEHSRKIIGFKRWLEESSCSSIREDQLGEMSFWVNGKKMSHGEARDFSRKNNLDHSMVDDRQVFHSRDLAKARLAHRQLYLSGKEPKWIKH